MYLLLLLGAIGCFKLISHLKDQVQFIREDLKFKRKYHEQLREEWRELLAEKPQPTYVPNNTVPDYLKEEGEVLKKDVLDLTKVVTHLKPIKHVQN